MRNRFVLCPSWRLRLKDSTEANESAPHKPRLHGCFFSGGYKKRKKHSVSTDGTFNWCVFASHCNTISEKKKILIRSYQC